MLKLIECVILSMAAQAFFGHANATENCGKGMYPPTIESWQDCGLEELGEVPIWQGLPARTPSVMRFVFTQGHGSFFRVVTITERANGTAVMKISGRDNYGIEHEILSVRRRRLTAETWSNIKQLSETSGNWDFEEGTWDSGDFVYMHCQFLEMERADARGYRYAVASIGCNQPRKLMPLIDEITRLARLRKTHNGMLYR